jgi:hypothetical protein
MSLYEFHAWLRWTHIAAGAIGLAAFWIPVVARKGGGAHRSAGQVFRWSALIVGVTGVVSSSWAMAAPVSFAELPAGLTAGELASRAATTRAFGVFLFMLSLLILSTITVAMKALELKRNPRALSAPLLVGIDGALGLASTGVLAYGLATQNVLFAVFALVGLATSGGHFQLRRNPLPTRMAWWYHHMGAMLGSGIAYHTAFLAFGARRFVSADWGSGWTLLAWMLPGLIGFPAIVMWTRYYRVKFRETGDGRTTRAWGREVLGS